MTEAQLVALLMILVALLTVYAFIATWRKAALPKKPPPTAQEEPPLKLSLLQRALLRMCGRVHTGDRQSPGWRGPLPFYAFNCPTHGTVEDYPHGHSQRLECPKCRAEAEEK